MAINLANPVNWQSPLNRGLVARFISISDYGGTGLYFRNIANKKSIGTLTNSPTWIGKRDQGNYGCISFTGSSSQSVEMSTTDFPTSGDMTFACRIRASAAGAIISFSNIGTPYTLIDLSVRASYVPRFQLYDGANNPFVDGTSDLSAVGLHTVICVRKSLSTIKVYVNGVEEGSSADTASGSLFSGPQLWAIGRRRDDFGSYATAVGDDFCGWNRALSADEVKLWHNEVRFGSPTTLNRTSIRATIFLPSAPAGIAANPLRGGGAAAVPLWGYIG